MEQSRSNAMHVAEETVGVFEEYKQRFFEAIETSRKQAEQESINIITEARQKAQQIADKMARETRKESARILTESAGLREQMISEAERFTKVEARLERNMEQEIGRAIEKVRQEASIVNEAARRVEKNIGEAGNKLRDELRESVRVITEMTQKLEPVTQVNEQEIGLELAHIVEPAEPTPVVTPEGEEVAEPTAAEGHDSTPHEAGEDNLFGGTLELSITPPGDSASLHWLLRCLSETPGLELITGVESTSKKTKVTVSLPKPLPLLSILKGMAPVKDAVEKDRNIQVTLEASVGN